jgi:hypothetical protein
MMQNVIYDRECRLCELIEGVRLEKNVGNFESRLAVFLGGLMNAFVIARDPRIVTGADGAMQIMADSVPDCGRRVYQLTAGFALRNLFSRDP